jgi:hypothetical protein
MFRQGLYDVSSFRALCSYEQVKYGWQVELLSGRCVGVLQLERSYPCFNLISLLVPGSSPFVFGCSSLYICCRLLVSLLLRLFQHLLRYPPCHSHANNCAIRIVLHVCRLQHATLLRGPEVRSNSHRTCFPLRAGREY